MSVGRATGPWELGTVRNNVSPGFTQLAGDGLVALPLNTRILSHQSQDQFTNLPGMNHV